MTITKPSLTYAFSSCGKSDFENNTATQKFLRSVFKLYILETLGFKTRSMTRREFKVFCDNLLLTHLAKELVKYREKEEQSQLLASLGKTLPLLPLSESRLVSLILIIFDRKFDAAVADGATSKGTKRNYRAALNQFLKRLDEQVFWQILDPSQFPEILPPSVTPDKRPPSRQQFPAYGLQDAEFLEHLREEIKQFRKFWTTGGEPAWSELRRILHAAGERSGRRPNVQKKSEATFDKDTKQLIRRFMGWCVLQGKSLEELSLKLLTDLILVEDYNRWLVEKRECTHKTGMHLTEISIALLKWFNFDKVKRQNWTDIELIVDFRDLHSEFKQKYKQEKKKSNKQRWRTKNLLHEQLQQICLQLKKNLAPFRGVSAKGSGKRVKGARRSPSAILWSWQVYLLVKILTYLPVRTHEIPQFETSITLYREIDKQGKPIYIAREIHHKQEYITGETRDYVLPSILTSDLDVWIQIERPKIQQATQTLGGWLAFTGHKLEDLEKLQQRLETARQDKSGDKTKYIKNLETRLRSLQHRVDAWQSAKTNIEGNKHLFVMFSKGNPKNFGKPLPLSSIYGMVVTATSRASKQLFEQSYHVNPHAFRHIAAARIREVGGDAEALSAAMNHSKEMGDMYAAQIEDGSDRRKNIDGWWQGFVK
ncbi:site-specific integrase [Leptolyngbya sp. FACHB-541]|uniref:site-specific integrase n=1 Tax=Leptolyngbya sp. FACHB-541 TaxID=2692810 RepID=UPI001689A650|nr:site-specific integrase [Leptolyngbya sp. FACHB-541]MBD1999219.1 site-specific integrase [Leptolyngbya sp. FACHB-541]